AFGIPVIATFAFSLSLTRFIAVYISWLPRNPALSIVAFISLLAVHLLLLLYWSKVVFLIEWLAMDVLFDRGRQIAKYDIILELTHADSFEALLTWQPPWFYPQRRQVLMGTVIASSHIAMAFVANGLRILFALLFLSSFVFRPLIQEPVSRLWYGA